MDVPSELRSGVQVHPDVAPVAVRVARLTGGLAGHQYLQTPWIMTAGHSADAIIVNAALLACHNEGGAGRSRDAAPRKQSADDRGFIALTRRSRRG